MKKVIWGIVIAGIAGFVYYRFNPENYALFPKCPFLVLTGLDCPGCGSQRAVHSLLHFNIADAFRYNALLVISLPIILLLLYTELTRKKYPDLYFSVHQPKYIWGYFLLVLLWFICRNTIF